MLFALKCLKSESPVHFKKYFRYTFLYQKFEPENLRVVAEGYQEFVIQMLTKRIFQGLVWNIHILVDL
jgi:hypothetical protein